MGKPTLFFNQFGIICSRIGAAGTCVCDLCLDGAEGSESHSAHLKELDENLPYFYRISFLNGLTDILALLLVPFHSYFLLFSFHFKLPVFQVTCSLIIMQSKAFHVDHWHTLQFLVLSCHTDKKIQCPEAKGKCLCFFLHIKSSETRLNANTIFPVY